MEVHEPKDPDPRPRQITRKYGEAVRVGVVVLAWTVVAFMAGCAAFAISKITWAFLQSVLRAVGEL